MRRRYTLQRNLELAPLPDDDAFLQAVEEICQKHAARGRSYIGATANAVGYQLALERSYRLGDGAVKGSWSGTQAHSQRTSSRLASMARRGLLARVYNRGRHHWEYWPA